MCDSPALSLAIPPYSQHSEEPHKKQGDQEKHDQCREGEEV
jgi:hypothetical protein